MVMSSFTSHGISLGVRFQDLRGPVGLRAPDDHNRVVYRRPSARLTMSETSVSLLQRLRHQPDPGSWQRLVDLYTPLLRDWLRRAALQPQDADDLIQDVFGVLV